MTNRIDDVKGAARNGAVPAWATARGLYQSQADALRHAEKAEIISEVLSAFIADCYACSDDGALRNIDTRNGCRILIYVPWAKRWVLDDDPALLATERTAVRAYLRYSQSDKAKQPPLFLRSGPQWYLNKEQYPTLRDALRWLRDCKIDGALYAKLDQQRRAYKRSFAQKARAATA